MPNRRFSKFNDRLSDEWDNFNKHIFSNADRLDLLNSSELSNYNSIVKSIVSVIVQIDQHCMKFDNDYFIQEFQDMIRKVVHAVTMELNSNDRQTISLALDKYRLLIKNNRIDENITKLQAHIDLIEEQVCDHKSKLYSEIQRLYEELGEFIKFHKSDMVKKNITHYYKCEDKRKEFTNQINNNQKVANALENEVDAFLLHVIDKVKPLRELKRKREATLLQWIDSYDREYSQLYNEFDGLSNELERVKELQNDWKKKMDKHNDEYLEIVEYRRIEDEIRRQHSIEMFILNRSARVIQRWYREFLEMRKRRKKRKGKRGKKKK